MYLKAPTLPSTPYIQQTLTPSSHGATTTSTLCTTATTTTPPQPPVMVRMLSFVEKPLETTLPSWSPLTLPTTPTPPRPCCRLSCKSSTRPAFGARGTTSSPSPSSRSRSTNSPAGSPPRLPPSPIGSTTSLGQKCPGQHQARQRPVQRRLWRHLCSRPQHGPCHRAAARLYHRRPVPAHFWNDDDESDPNPRAVAFTLFPAILGTVVRNVAFDGAITIASEFPPFSVLADVDDFGSIMEPIGKARRKVKHGCLGHSRARERSKGDALPLKCEFRIVRSLDANCPSLTLAPARDRSNKPRYTLPCLRPSVSTAGP